MLKSKLNQSVSNSQIRKICSTFFVTLICFLFTYITFGVYYVEYEALANSFLSGKITPGVPFRAVYFLMHHGTSHIYSMLYEHYPNVEWLSWILTSYFFLATFLGLYIIGGLIPKSRPVWEIILWQVLVYLLVYADHNIHFIFTRISYVTVGVSFLALIYYFRSVADIKNRPYLFTAINILFLIGALCRIESSAALALLIFFFSCLYLGSIRQSIILFFFPVSFLAIFILAIGYKISNSTEFYAQVEPEIEAQFVERQNKIDISEMKSHEDSVKYKMAAEIAWVDPTVISPEFMRSMIREEGFMYTDMRQWKRVLGDIIFVSKNNWGTVFFSLALVFCILGIGKGPGKFKWLAYLSFFWFYLFIQAYTFKINDRSFLPNASMFVLSLFMVSIPVFYERKNTVWGYVYGATVLGFLSYQIYYLSKESKILSDDLSHYQFNRTIIEREAQGKYLVVNSSSFDYLFLSHKPFVPFDYSAFKKIYITDGHVIPYIPYYRPYLENDCKCNVYEFPSFWTYLKSIRDEVVIISTPQRMEVLKEYLSVIYGYQLNIEPINSASLHAVRKSDYRNVFWDLEMYSLKSDTISKPVFIY